MNLADLADLADYIVSKKTILVVEIAVFLASFCGLERTNRRTNSGLTF